MQDTALHLVVISPVTLGCDSFLDFPFLQWLYWVFCCFSWGRTYLDFFFFFLHLAGAFFLIYCQFFPCLPTVPFPQAHSDQIIQPLQLLSLGLALLRISVFSELLLSEHVVSLDLPRTLELPVPFSWDPFPISWVSCFPPSWFISMCWSSMFSSSFFG